MKNGLVARGRVHIFEVYIGEVVTVVWLCDEDLELRKQGKGARPPQQIGEPEGFDGACTDCTRRADGSSTLGAPSFRTPAARIEYERGHFNTREHLS
jgi:hypothetical protein